jgi:hypothetical protein
MIRIFSRLFILFTYSQTVIPPIVRALLKLHGGCIRRWADRWPSKLQGKRWLPA